MRFLIHLAFPHEPFNTYVRDGSAGQKIGRILEQTKPESIYFTEHDGQRGATAIYEVSDPSGIPAVAEPWFLTFEADVQMRIAMSAEDLMQAGLEDLGKRWA